MSYDIMMKQAISFYENGHFQEAEKVLRQLSEIIPENPDIFNLLGLIAQQQNLHNQAVELFYAACKINHNPEYYFNMGYSLIAINKIHEAESSFAKVLELSPNLKEAVYFLGVCAEKRQDLAQAQKYYEQSLEQDSTYFEPKLALAVMSKDINKLIELDEEIHDNYLIKINISKMYFEDGNLDEALKYAKEAYKIYQQDDDVCLFYGILLLKSKDKQSAKTLFDKALNINNKNVSALINLANIFCQDKEYKHAEELYREAINLAPDDFDAHLNLATLLYNNDRKLEALDEYRSATLINPSNTELCRNLATFLIQENEYEEALGLLFTALNLSNDNDEISIHIAETLISMQDKDKSVKIAENWCKSMPENVFAIHTLKSLKNQTDDNNLYIEKLFDKFADTYNSVLKNIDYKVAEIIAEYLENFHGTVIDLGCGSGLVAQNCNNTDVEFIGVDLSAKMLDIAQKTGKYKKLHKSDIVSFLRTHPKADIIVAADVFCYISDLSEIFNLMKGYKICFSVEALNEADDYIMQNSGRYAHSQEYITKLLEDNCFANIKVKEKIIRYENGLPIKGYIFFAE